jgi:hypothetical protein
MAADRPLFRLAKELYKDFGKPLVDEVMTALGRDAEPELVKKVVQQRAKAAAPAAPRPRKAVKVPVNATGERVPYVGSGQLSGIVGGDEATRAAYSADPRASWTGAGGRDIIYDALGVKQLPTLPATGFYTPPGGILETNPATVPRPFGSVQDGDIDPTSRSMLDLAESLRAYTDAQGAGAYHVGLSGVDAAEQGSLSIPTAGPTSADTLKALQDLGGAYGLPDVVDTGSGITMTNFYPGPPSGAETEAALAGNFGKELRGLVAGEPQRAKVAAGYLPMFEEADGMGSGIATGRMADLINRYPQSTIARLDASPALRERYASGAALDAEMAQRGFGVAREDIQNARRLMAEGGVDALMAAFREGKIALPAVAGLLGLSALPDESEGSAY